MCDYPSFNDFTALRNLLNPKADDESSDDEEHITKKSTNTYLSPADIPRAQTETQSEEKVSKVSPYEKIKEKSPVDYEDEINEKVEEIVNCNSWKKAPAWDISYKQSVSASDVFLQLGNKNPTTSSCENMVVKIELPNEARQSIDLKIFHSELELISSQYYLKIPLPQRVNPQLGNAQFDNEAQSLLVTLVMDREFDFVNF